MTKSDEQWKPVTGYEGLYEISNHGRVRSFYASTPRILQVLKGPTGYRHYRLYLNRRGRTLKTHRLVATHFIQNPNQLPEVNHKDVNKANNHWGNLEWATHLQNMEHASRSRAMKVGEERADSKLTDKGVIAIRELRRAGSTLQAIAAQFGVHHTTIRNVCLGLQWRHVI